MSEAIDPLIEKARALQYEQLDALLELFRKVSTDGRRVEMEAESDYATERERRELRQWAAAAEVRAGELYALIERWRTAVYAREP